MSMMEFLQKWFTYERIIWAFSLLLFSTLGYFFVHIKKEVGKFNKWLKNIAFRNLPWNKTDTFSNEIKSETMIVSLVIDDRLGKKAFYSKKSVVTVSSEFADHINECVTCTGDFGSIKSSVGHISSSKFEHGFLINKIDLDRKYKKNEKINYEFSADLLETFTSIEEDWSQEVSIDTKLLEINVSYLDKHIPRQIKLYKIRGTSKNLTGTSATQSTSSDRHTFSWKIKNPEIGIIYKIEWIN
ncbi:MAG: hypothetical protein ACRCWF_07930 [Beijerinckiaceae bacterium]